MKTVQMRLDDELLDQLDAAARRRKTTRTGFTRLALRAAIERERIADLERQDREAYRRKPVRPGEFDVSDDGRGWPD